MCEVGPCDGRRCRCGAPTCRGTMDNQPERMRDFGHRIEVGPGPIFILSAPLFVIRC